MNSRIKRNKVILDTDESEEEISQNIFHYLTKECDFDNNRRKYYFILTNGEKRFYDEIVSVFDPGYDTTFKELFLNNPERLEDFLNNVYLENKTMKISDLEFLEGSYYDIGKPRDFNSLSSDLTCKAKIKDRTLLIDVEIQIGWRDILDDRLFEYGSLLRYRYTNQERSKKKEEIENKKLEKDKDKDSKNDKIERHYNDTIVIAFILDNQLKNENLSSLINLNKKKNNENNSILLKGLEIVEIHLFYEVEKIVNGEFNTLFGNKLSKYGQDWLKLIGLRCWARKSNDIFKYVLPKLKENEKYSQNEYINDAIINLIKGTQYLDNLYDNMNILLEQNGRMIKKVAKKIGEKIGEIKTVYSLFIKKQDPLSFIKLSYIYSEKEIKEIAEEYLKEMKIGTNELSNFIEYMTLKGYIID